MTALGVSYDFNLGDVIRGKHRQAYHYILYIKDLGDETGSFEGCMLTSKAGYEDNKLMQKEFIKEFDEYGNRFIFQFENTHIVQARFLKKKDWAPFEKVGELIEEGIKFVMLVINGLSLEDFEEYKKSSKRK